MTLVDAIGDALGEEYRLVELSFSSQTTPDLIFKTLIQYCDFVDSPSGPVMRPTNRQGVGLKRGIGGEGGDKTSNGWSGRLVVFCDEINLPDCDDFGSQAVISLLRQLMEQGGYYDKRHRWVRLQRVTFVGACNPPSDKGRMLLSHRFLQRIPVLYIGYPHNASLKQIYRTFIQALLKPAPQLRGFVEPLCSAMICFYTQNQDHFSSQQAPQYLYSPRELSRWVRAMHSALSRGSGTDQLKNMSPAAFIRLWAHEGLRLFQDRLMTDTDKGWCHEAMHNVAIEYFSRLLDVGMTECLEVPLIFSTCIDSMGRYMSIDRDSLRAVLKSKISLFCDEVVGKPLVIFDELLDWVCRIDNVLRNPMGHLLLVGESGVGKRILTKFAAWMQDLTVFQVKTDGKYSLADFDADLRKLLQRTGAQDEKICFIFDESNVLSSAFLERMNSLLASGKCQVCFREKTSSFF